MIIKVSTKSGNIYLTQAIELINNGLDIRFMDIEGDYVIVDAHQVDEIELREYK